MQYLNISLFDLKEYNQIDFQEIITELENSFCNSVIESYNDLDGIKFNIYLRKIIDKLFKSIKSIEKESAKDEKLKILLNSYNKTYKILEIEYKEDLPNAFKKHIMFWTLKDHKSIYLNNPKLFKKHIALTGSNSVESKKDNERDKILMKLIKTNGTCLNGEDCQKVFDSFEYGLYIHKYIDEDYKKWSKDKGSASLHRFAKFCTDERHRVLKDHFKHNIPLAVKYFRKLYNFQDGEKTSDSPNKIKRNCNSRVGEFAKLLKF